VNAWTHEETLSFLVNFALDSVKLKSLTIEQRRKGKKILRKERPHVHILLSAPKGQIKSTILKEISDHCQSPVFTNISFASLVGSIDKETKQVLPAGAWECRNNLLLMDEWNFGTDGHDDTLKALLQLTEGGEYSRRIARYAAPFESEKDDLPLFFRAKNGQISIRTRFSLIMASMYDLTFRTQLDTEALVSRMIPYRFQMSRTELNTYASGKQVLDITPNEKVPAAFTIKLPKFRKIIHFCEKASDENALRTYGDVARCYAIYGWKPKLFDFIIDRKNLAEEHVARAREKNAERYANLKRGEYADPNAVV
jgi:hypothetical protein